MSVCPPVHDVCTTSYLRAWVIKLLLVGDHRPSACMFQPNSYITNTTIIHLWQIESGLAKLYVRKKATCVQIIPWYIGWETFQTSLKDVWEQMYNYGEDHNGKLLFNHKQEEHNKQKLGKLLTIMIPALLSLSFFVDCWFCTAAHCQPVYMSNLTSIKWRKLSGHHKKSISWTLDRLVNTRFSTGYLCLPWRVAGPPCPLPHGPVALLHPPDHPRGTSNRLQQSSGLYSRSAQTAI